MAYHIENAQTYVPKKHYNINEEQEAANRKRKETIYNVLHCTKLKKR